MQRRIVICFRERPKLGKLSLFNKKQKLLLGNKYQYPPALIKNFFGEPLHPNTLADWFTKLIEKNDLPHVTLQGLRHSCASVLTASPERAISLKDIQLWLGHSDIQSTMRYAHLSDVKAKVHIANVIHNILLSKTEEKRQNRE